MQNIVVKKQAQRWITQIDNGKVTLVHRIENDAVVISINELAELCANVELVSDDQARLIAEAIKAR